MPAQNDIEMQYKAAEPMAASQGEPSNANAEVKVTWHEWRA